MAVFPETTSLYYKGRTNTQLVVSEGNAPAEKYLASEAENENIKFYYEFGPENNNAVVIPKGKILAFAGVEYDVESEKHVPRVKICNGNTDVPMGVNHHNVYQRRRDRFSGSSVTVITREYIRIPLFSGDDAEAANAAAKAIQFGAAWATSSDPNDLYGKYVKADENGNFMIADPTTDRYDKIVGQIYGIETDIPPAGFLQYFMEFSDEQWEQFVKTTQIVPSPGRTKDKANTLDIDTFPVGTGYFKTTRDYAEALKNFRAGIPFLTDGYFKARTEKTYATLADAGILDVRTMGHVELTQDKKVKVNDHIGAALFVRLRDKLCKDALPKFDVSRGVIPEVVNYPEYGNVPPQNIVVKVAGEVVSAANLHVDYENNLVVIYFTKAIKNPVDVSITAVVLENQIPGIPTGWDYKNNIGEVRILLMK